MNQMNLFEANQAPLFPDLDSRYSEPDNESKRAFNKAIQEGRLSEDKNAHNFAGKFMYMGNPHGQDLFKHIWTREYLPIV